MTADISGPADLEALLEAFYARAFADPLLGHVFVDVVQMDLAAHLPRITAFWERVLLGTGSYAGRPMAVHLDVHRQVALTSEHFDQWLALWRATVHERHAGPVAEAAVAHAERTAVGFLRGLAQAPDEPARSLPLLPGG